jgi:hypothetical protein
MLKKYQSPSKLRFVGKAWEIRHALRQAKKNHGGHTTLARLLAAKNSP